MLSRDQILAGPKPSTETVKVPALGGEVRVRQLTVGERDRFEVSHAKADNRDFRARLVVATALGEDDKPLFGFGDIEALSALAGHVLDPIVEAAVRVNKLTADEVRTLEKN